MSHPGHADQGRIPQTAPAHRGHFSRPANGLAAAAGILAGCCLPPLGFGASGPVLIAVMPSAVLGPVFAVRYKCDGELASTVTFMNILLAALGIPVVFWLLGR